MTAPRRLQLRRGNTAAISTYVGAAGELVVNTTTNTLYLHDGSTVGGFATTSNITAINNQISSVNANITLANTGMQGYVNLANTIQSAQLTSANLGIIGYIDLANTIQSAQVGAANLAITAANLGMKGYVDSVASQSIYGNGNVKSYLTSGFDGNILPSANVTYSLGSPTQQWRDLFVSNNTIYIGGVPLSINASGSLTVAGNVIAGTNLVTYGSNVSASAVTLSGPTGAVGNVHVLDPGNGFTMFGFFAGSGGSGTGFSIVAQNSTIFNPVQFNIRGTGYRVGDVITIVNTNTGPGYSDATVVVTELLGIASPGIYLGNTAYRFGADGNIRLPAGGGILDSTGVSVLGTGGTNYSNVNVAAYTTTQGYTNYSNVNVAAYVTTANSAVIGYVDNKVSTANVGVIGYVDLANTIQSAQITAANLGMRGYVDNQITTIIGSAPAILDTLGELANALGADANLSVTITSQIANVNANITTANLGMRGYVDSQSFYSNVKVATYLPTYSGNIAANISKAGYTWTFGTNGTTQFPNSLILAPAGESITMQSDQYSQLMWENANLTVAPNMAINSNFYVTQNNATLDIGYRDGSSTQLIKSWYWSVDGNLKLPSGGYILNSDDSIYGGGDYSNVQVATYLPTYSGVVTASNVAVAGNVTAQYLFGNGSQLTGIIAGTSYSNVQVATYLPTYSGVVTASNVAVAGNVTAIRFFGDGGTLSNVTFNVAGNVTGTSANVTLQAGAYTSVFDNQGNVTVPRLFTAGNIQTAGYLFGNGALLTGIVAGSSYSNVQVETYLPTYAGTVSASLVNTSGNILSSGLSVFGNTRIGLAGAVSGQFHTVVGNITQTSSGGAVYINTTGNVLAAAVVAGAVTSTGTVAVNAATGITTNQATFLFANATATTINMGGAATTINLGTTASATGNVFVGGQIGSNAYNLTLRANGRYNVATSIDSNGGFNSPPYANQLVIGGTGTGMTANYSATGGYLTTLTIYNSGTGYRNGDVISVPGGIAGNSFVLQNYSPSRVGAFTGTALYTFGIDGNLTLPGNVITSSSGYFMGNAGGTTAAYTGNVSAANFIGSGALLTALPGYAYSNVNVASYLSTATITTTGNVTANYFVGSGSLLSGVATKTTGSWTVTAGTNTYSFTVASGTYQLWVDCNIPNGILAWNATATVTNSNVPVVGQQFAWVYNGGGTPIDFTSIPNQFTGTGNTIVRSSVSPSATTNRFDFGINNTSGGNVTVSYGYVKIS